MVSQTATPIAVSYSGSILHNKDGDLQTFSSSVNLENFKAKVDFFAPSNAQDKLWNFAILFKSRRRYIKATEYGLMQITVLGVTVFGTEVDFNILQVNKDSLRTCFS